MHQPWRHLLAAALSCVSVCRSASVSQAAQQYLDSTQEYLSVPDPIEHGEKTESVNVTASRPFWAIAHRVLVKDGIDAAIKHGANALEMDYTAWWTGKDSPGWWADHDGSATSWGDEAKDMFNHIADKRRGGANIVFVWLDIKNPNDCDPNDKKWYKCSVHHLQDLARKILLPAGVRVLYGTNSDKEIEKGAYSKLASRGLDPAEAIDIDGNYDTTSAMFQKYGSKHGTPTRQRVMSKGLFGWHLNIGSILRNLQKASASGEFGRTFGWTMINEDSNTDNIKQLIRGGSDGLIYGGILHYQDGRLSKGPLRYIKQVVEADDSIHFAQVKDQEWPW